MTFHPGPAETRAVPVVTTDPTKAVILGAGAGSRLGALTATTPRCLLPIDGRTLLDRELDALATVGITDVTVVVGHMADRVIEHVGSRCRIVRNARWASTNSIVSLHEAADGLRGSAFLLQNGDVLYPPAILKRLLRVRHGSACLVDPLRPTQPSDALPPSQRRFVRLTQPRRYSPSPSAAAAIRRSPTSPSNIASRSSRARNTADGWMVTRAVGASGDSIGRP